MGKYFNPLNSLFLLYLWWSAPYAFLLCFLIQVIWRLPLTQQSQRTAAECFSEIFHFCLGIFFAERNARLNLGHGSDEAVFNFSLLLLWMFFYESGHWTWYANAHQQHDAENDEIVWNLQTSIRPPADHKYPSVEVHIMNNHILCAAISWALTVGLGSYFQCTTFIAFGWTSCRLC